MKPGFCSLAKSQIYNSIPLAMNTDGARNWDSMVLIYRKVPGVKPDLLEGRQRYIPITCTLSPGFMKNKKDTILLFIMFNPESLKDGLAGE